MTERPSMLDASPTKAPPLRIMVDADDAAAALSIGVRTFHRLVADQKLPPARQISKGRVGWLVSELQEAAARLPVAPRTPREVQEAQA